MSEHFDLAPWRWTDEYQTPDGGKAWTLVNAEGYGLLSCDEPNSPQGLHLPEVASAIAALPALVRALREVAREGTFKMADGSEPHRTQAAAIAHGALREAGVDDA